MPKHQETVVLENISAARYLSIAATAMKNLGWNVVSRTTTEVLAESPTSFMKNSWGELISVYAINNTAEITSKSKGSVLFDWGRNRKNVNYLKNHIATLQPSWPVDEPAAAEQAAGAGEQQPVYGRAKEHESFLHFFIPKGNFFITPILIELNIAVFIFMVASGVSFIDPTIADLLHWGANFKPLVMGGEWWRLLTCVFVHAGIIHVAFNMYALFFIGVYLEPLLGRLRFATAYLAAGLCSSLTSTWWHGNGMVGVGASGAIFGLYGVFLALLTTNIIDKRARQSLLTSVGIFVGYTLLYGLSHKEVDNAAHVGGLLSGLLIGYVFYFTFREPSEKKNRNISMAVAAATLVIGFVYLTNGKTDGLKFSQKYDAFIALQNEALAPLQSGQLSDAELSRRLEETSLPDWKKAKRVMDSTLVLKLDSSLSRKRQLALQYADLRIEQTTLLLKWIKEGGLDSHQQEIEASVKAMNELVEALDKP
ncbi:MAG TPA: rhomboid family intramembrane serine protease [Chitinophagaceae bacterium]